jgi:hypothetical protein
MDNDVSGFHHLGIISRDMAAAIRQYERLGFIFTPLSVPHVPLTPGGAPEPLGVANRCAIFRDNYLEMLGVIDAARWASITVEQRGPYDIDRPLRRYEGLHVMHFNADNIEATRARLEEGGRQPSPIRPFQRMIDTPEGPKLMRAKVLSFAPAANPEALLQIAQHETPELVLQPRFMVHPNGALSLSEAIVCVENPDEIAMKYEAYTGHRRRDAGGLRIIDLGTSRIVVIGPDHLGAVVPGFAAPTYPFLAGFTVAADMDAARRVLSGQAVDFKVHDGRIVVQGHDAAGAAVLFERPGMQR